MPALPMERVAEVVRELESKLLSPRWTIRRDALGCLLGLHGLRIQEVCNLELNDFDRKTGRMRIETLKGGPTKWLPMRREIHTAIKNEIKHGRQLKAKTIMHTSKGRALDDRNLRRRWSQWCKEIIGKEFRFHDLRHTTAQVVWERSKNVFAVQHVLRHAKIENTAIYLTPEEEIESWMPSASSQ